MEASLKSVTAALGTLRVGAADSEERLHEQAAEAFMVWRGVRPQAGPVLSMLRAALAEKSS